MKTLTISVLGSDWTIKEGNDSELPEVKHQLGCCDWTSRTIYINTNEKYLNKMDSPWRVREATYRHEIIHAFLYEAGLGDSANDADCWSTNEEMVDWFAYQWPKIQEIFEKLNISTTNCI